MLVFYSPNHDRLARVTAHPVDRLYTIAVFSRKPSAELAQPLAQYELRGTPNQAQISEILPGWTSAPNTVVPEQPSVPPSVTAWQLRRWLVTNGYALESVDAAIAAIPDAAQRDAVRVDWEWAPHVERTHPMIAPLAAALGIEDIDAAFIQAERLG